MTYEWEKGMREISGFAGMTFFGASGDVYENDCRAMVKAGCEWFDKHPDADPQFEGYEGVYGLLKESNMTAKALSKHITKVCKGGCSGAMHQAAINHILAIRRLGWDKYVKEMKKRVDKPI